MAGRFIPEGHNSVSPYLIVPGAGKLIDFAKATFDAKELHRSARPDGTVQHAEVRIGDSIVMIAEATPDFRPTPGVIHVYVNDVDATYKRALQAGATSMREPAHQFYGDRNAGVKDAFGNQWWIATHTEDVSPEEMARREKATSKQPH